MTQKVIIVGGVAGGASAAARLRRLDEDAEIVLFEKDEYISYANCGLPYYIGGTIQDRERLLVQTPEAMRSLMNIDVRICSEVVGLDPEKKTVQVNSKDRGSYEESYDWLVLSPGARAIRPNIPGIDHPSIFTLRNIPDMDRIKGIVDDESVRRAVVIGGGFVGVEVAENLADRGIGVTLVEAAPHILAPFDSDMVTIAEQELESNNVQLILADGVKSFADQNGGIEVTLNSNTKLVADIVVLAIGVTPETGFLKGSGIELGPKGHILVNENLQTNIAGVTAVGDAVEVVDFVNGQKTAIPLAGPANKQGRIVADNICGLNTTYKGSQGTSILKVFGVTGAATGNNERTLSRQGIDYRVIQIHPNSHAGYYPGATPLSIKLIFNDEGTILGAQIFGYEGADKRIDDIATVIRLHGTVTDLTELELAYAPPYSSAKDPVNMAGYVAENVLTGKMEVFLPKDLSEFDQAKAMLLDVRTEDEYNNGHLDGAVNIPVASIRNRLNELPKDKEIWVYCRVGLSGYLAFRILTQKGYKAKNLTGGYKGYLNANFQPSKLDKPLVSIERQPGFKAVVGEAVSTGNGGEPAYDKQLDACGLCCPGPLMQVKAYVDAMEDNQVLKVIASDPGFYNDIKAWTKRTNNELVELKKQGSNITAYIKKLRQETNTGATVAAPAPGRDNQTMVVFSGDFDKALASFIIANGAAAMGKQVTMFFTFWGLNILRKDQAPKVEKGFIQKMFGFMMPQGSKKLKLSKMHMLGMGTKLMRHVMKNQNISSLDELITAAIDSGVEIVACQMSMDVMGLKQEELIPGVKIGGVGYFLGEAHDSNVNLFI